jgi:aryl-alcohol dehydrogenase-like predicted oxidoreductase
LTAFAEQRGHTLLELAIGWLLSQPVVSSVIAGATRPEQITANVAAAAWRLSPEEVTEVAKLAN